MFASETWTMTRISNLLRGVFFASPKVVVSILSSLLNWPLNGARLLFTRHAVGTESWEMEDARIDFDQASWAGLSVGNLDEQQEPFLKHLLLDM